MKIRGLNKRAQEVVSNFGVVGIVGIVFLVVIILGIWYVNTKAQDLGGVVPENAEAIAQACNGFATESTVNTYCLKFMEIRSDVYSTCDKISSYNIVVPAESASEISLMNEKCKAYSTQLTDKTREACSSGEYKGKPGVEINKVKCSEYIVGASCDLKPNTVPKVCAGLKEPDCTALSYCNFKKDATDNTKSVCEQKPACTTLDSSSCGLRSDCIIVYK